MAQKFEPVGLYSGRELKNWHKSSINFFKLWGPLILVSGAAGGVGAIFFKILIMLNQDLFFGILGSSNLTLVIPVSFFNTIPIFFLFGRGIPVIFLPVLGALIVGPIVYKWASEAWGHGVPEVMEALRSRGGRIRSRVAFVKIVASSITIGSGGSAGREGPIAQIGASISSIVGRLFHLDERSLRLLVMAGASAGISGTFKAPIGGALFGLEVLNNEIRTTDLVVMALSSMVGYIVSVAILGPAPIFLALNIKYEDIDMPFYFLLGIVGGLAAYLWTRSLYGVEDLFARFRVQRKWYSPSLGAWVVGGIGMFYPMTMGLGYTVLNSFFSGNLIIPFVGGSLALGFLVLLFAKLGTSVFTIGSGGSGGVFSPSLFMGAMLGALFGLFVAWAFPWASPGYYSFALVGMGVIFAGAAKAPLMSTIIVAEMAGNFTLLPGLFIACVTSYLISGPGSIYIFKVQRTVGQHIPDKYLATPQLPAMALIARKVYRSAKESLKNRSEGAEGMESGARHSFLERRKRSEP